MAEYQTQKFKLGDTTFDSMFSINLPYNYGESVPECHSHCPIPYYFMQPLYNIVNMINRGLKVQFENEDETERVYLFLVEYNRVARNYNKQLGEEVNPIASEAEEYFYTKMKTRFSKDQEVFEKGNENPFNKPIAPKQNDNIVKLQIKSMMPNKKKVERIKSPEEHKMYEIFNSENLIAPDGSIGVTPKTDKDFSSLPGYIDDRDFNQG